MMLDSSSVSPEPELAHETDKTLNAFDLLKEAQKKQLTAQERKEKRKANQFVAEQADESEDDTPSAALRKAADGDDDEGSDSDLDGSVEGLVDDQGVPDEEKEEQDKLARDKHQEQVAADAEKLGKRIEKIVAGQERKRKAAEDLLDDSDYEDDEGAFLKKARAKKPKKFGKITEALGALAFALDECFPAIDSLQEHIDSPFSRQRAYSCFRWSHDGHRWRRDGIADGGRVSVSRPGRRRGSFWV